VDIDCSGFVQVSWLTIDLLALLNRVPSGKFNRANRAFPSALADSGMIAAFVTITVAGQRKIFTSFPETKPKKSPNRYEIDPGIALFNPQILNA